MDGEKTVVLLEIHRYYEEARPMRVYWASLSVILVVALLLGCARSTISDGHSPPSSEPGKDAALRELGSKLVGAGLFRFDPEESRPELESQIYEYGTPIVFGSHRVYIGDAEALAEGGVQEFLREVEPFLTSNGVHITDFVEDYTEQGYFVEVNGSAYTIWQHDEAEYSWTLGTKRTFAMVNELLERAGSKERLHAVYYGGNEQLAVFLTPDMYELIRESPALPDKEKPVSVEDMRLDE